MILKSYTPVHESSHPHRSKFSHAENRRFDAFMYLFFIVLVLSLAIYTSL